ncbi:MAG: hypothetical protein U0X91_27885 [Spirosomataceae bacterium]
MKKRMGFVCFCVLMCLCCSAQQKPPKPAAVKKNSVSPKKQPGAPVKNPAVAKPKEPNRNSPAEVPLETVAAPTPPAEDNETDLKKIEAKNQAELAKNGQEAAYYRMDRSSITVLPVHLFVPGLREVNKETYKPIYTPKQLFEARRLKNHVGDVLTSEKYFYNKVRFNTHKMFTELLQDSTDFFSLTALKSSASSKKAAPQGTVAPDEFSDKIRRYLENSNVGTDILKIWTNKSILMSRIYYSQSEADKRERVDPKKLAVFEKLLRKNYVLVVAIINPEKKTEQHEGYTTELFSAEIEGFLYRVDTTHLEGNNIRNKHPLQFVKRFSLGSQKCDPRSEVIVEALGGGTKEQLREKINTLIVSGVREQAHYFYKNKAYACAKNYYEYALAAGLKDSDTPALKALLEECKRQITKTKAITDDKTCLVNETSAYEDWVYAQSATNDVLKEVETELSEEFGVKSFIYKVKPYITVEIGKKEGVYTDQRFLVYRKTLSKEGKEGRQRVATLRAVKVADNTDKFKEYAKEAPAGKTPVSAAIQSAGIALTSTSNNRPPTAKTAPKPPSVRAMQAKTKDSLMRQDLQTMSVFKQIDGGQIQEKDLVIQNEDSGLGIQVGYGSRLGLPAPVLGMDYRMADLLKSRMPLSGLKIGINIGLPNKKKVADKWDIAEDKAMVLDLYLARELYLSPKFDLKPFAGVSTFNDKYHLLLGMAGYLNVIGKNSNTKVKLAPEISYVMGYTYQTNINLRFEF